MLKKQTRALQQGYKKILASINNVNDIFKICHFSYQLKLIRKIFQTGLSFDGTLFRTSYIHPAFIPLLDNLAEKRLLVFEQFEKSEDSSHNQLSFDNEKIAKSEQGLASFIVKLVEDILIKD